MFFTADLGQEKEETMDTNTIQFAVLMRKGPKQTLKELGTVSHKMSTITIFGHKYLKEKFVTTFDIFPGLISTTFNIGSYLEF